MGFSWLLIQFRNNIQKYSKKTTFIGFGYVWSEGLTHIQTHMDRLQIKTILMICTRGSYSAYKWLFNEYIPTCACKFKKASDDFCLLLLSFFLFVSYLFITYQLYFLDFASTHHCLWMCCCWSYDPSCQLNLASQLWHECSLLFRSLGLIAWEIVI